MDKVKSDMSMIIKDLVDELRDIMKSRDHGEVLVERTIPNTFGASGLDTRIYAKVFITKEI